MIEAFERDPFAIASVHFEQNATDADVEVVFEVRGGDEGLTQLTVVSPDGRMVSISRLPMPGRNEARSSYAK